LKRNKSASSNHQIILAAAAAAPLLMASFSGAAAFTYSGASGGTWSTAGNWTGTGTPPPTTNDTAILDTTSTGRSVIYDSAASGSLNTLTLNQTLGQVNLLDMQRSSFTITNGVTLGVTSSR